jgi:hypothetical protein
MIRVILAFIVPFLLVVIVYVLWLKFTNKVITGTPIFTTLLSGKQLRFFFSIVLVLVLSAGFIFAIMNGTTTDSIYIPPSYEEGKVIPGFFKER